MSKRETASDTLADLMKTELLGEEITKRLNAYKVDYMERLKQLSDEGKIKPNRTTLPIEESRILMEKHGLLGALSGVSGQEKDDG